MTTQREMGDVRGPKRPHPILFLSISTASLDFIDVFQNMGTGRQAQFFELLVIIVFLAYACAAHNCASLFRRHNALPGLRWQLHLFLPSMLTALEHQQGLSSHPVENTTIRSSPYEKKLVREKLFRRDMPVT